MRVQQQRQQNMTSPAALVADLTKGRSNVQQQLVASMSTSLQANWVSPEIDGWHCLVWVSNTEQGHKARHSQWKAANLHTLFEEGRGHSNSISTQCNILDNGDRDLYSGGILPLATGYTV